MAPLMLLPCFRRSNSVILKGGGASLAQRRFLCSDETLVRKLKEKHVEYRLRAATSSRDRYFMSQLGGKEIDWMIQEINATSPYTTEQRRKLICMARSMTQKDMPLGYVMGHQPFGSLPRNLLVRPPLLIPRPETEQWATDIGNRLCKHLFPVLAKRDPVTQPFKILDLCTGSGCIAVLLAHMLHQRFGAFGWQIIACDRSAEAVQLARENAQRLRIPSEAIQIHQADIFSDSDIQKLRASSGEDQPFDLIVSNPPYIPRSECQKLEASVKLWEDPVALIGEANLDAAAALAGEASVGPTDNHLAATNPSSHDGLDFYKRLAELVKDPSFLVPKPVSTSIPRLAVEFGKGQTKKVDQIFKGEESTPPPPPAPKLLPTKPPQPRKVITLPGSLVIVGLGNYTDRHHRHSMGQFMLENLVNRLTEREEWFRAKLETQNERLEDQRQYLVEHGKVDIETHPEWNQPIQGYTLPKIAPEGKMFELHRKQRGWNTRRLLTIDPLLLDRSSNSKTNPSSSSEPPPLFCINVHFFKPRKLMNLIGPAIPDFLDYRDIPFNASTIMLLHDDMTKPPGSLTLKWKGSALGHNGIRSVFSYFAIDTNVTAFPRMRIGIGHPNKPGQEKPGKKKPRHKKHGHKSIVGWLVSKPPNYQLDLLRSNENVIKLDKHGFKTIQKGLPGSVLENATKIVLDWMIVESKKLHQQELEKFPKQEVLLKPSPSSSESIISSTLSSTTPVVRTLIRNDQFGIERCLWLY